MNIHNYYSYIYENYYLFEEKIELLLTYIPYNYSELSIQDGIFIDSIAKETGCKYIGGNEILVLLDQNVDFYSTSKDNSHLNWSGAQKVTDYFGKFIMTNYQGIIKDHRGDIDYTHWEDDCRDFFAYRSKRIQALSTLEEVFVESYGSQSIEIETNNLELIQIIWNRYSLLLENIGVNIQDIVYQDNQTNGMWLEIRMIICDSDNEITKTFEFKKDGSFKQM